VLESYGAKKLTPEQPKSGYDPNLVNSTGSSLGRPLNNNNNLEF